MAMIKLAKHLPKRCTNEKRKVTRQRSYNTTQTMKLSRMATRRQDELNNRMNGYTGKEFDDALRRHFGADYRTYKRRYQNAEFTCDVQRTGPSTIMITMLYWSE